MALSVMESYKARTNGSYTWRNAASVGFSYYMADPEFGRLQASSLTNVLKTTLRAFSVKVVHEAGTVFCAPQGVDKGAFCARIAVGNMDTTTSSLNERPFVKSVESTRAFDFVLCMGDNLSDEHMFEVVNKFGTGSRGDSRHVGSALDQNSLSPNIGTKRRRSHRGGSAKGGVFTVTIRPKPTNAKYYVDSVEDVHDVVESLAVLERNKSSPMRKSFSLSSMSSSSGGGFVTKAQLHGVMGRGGSHRNHNELHGKKQAVRKRVYRDVDTRTSKGPPGKIPSSAKSKSLTQLRRNGLTKTRAWWKSPKKLFLLWITVYLLFARRKWGARLTRYFFGRG